MFALQAVVLGTLLSMTWSIEDLAFPPGFKFGVATAAYQVEGGWNASDKGESIWDTFTHDHPEHIKEQATGDVACDSYTNWERDVEMIEELGVHFYRFSISWSRLLPRGFSTHISEDGKNYYNNLIDGLLAKGIEPMVTLYHWDLPQRLQNLGGWANPLVSDWFADYARVAFTLFGDRVKTWITLNEMVIFCDLAYNIGTIAPGIFDEEVPPYLCNKHALMAHAKAYRMYDAEFRDRYHGRLSLSTQLLWFEPMRKEHEELAELARWNMVRGVHPIFSKEGGWPPAMEKILGENSRKLGYPRSSLPTFSKEEKEMIRGTFDFFAMNHYTSRLIRYARPGETFGPWPLQDCKDLNGIVQYHPAWNKTSASWFYVNPQGIRRQLVWLKKQYGNLNFVITENGLATNEGLNDVARVQYYQEYLEQVLLAIKQDGVNVTGYTAWSLMDNFEWMDGYQTKFGLYEVRMSSPQRGRTARASARYYARVVAAHSLNVSDDVYDDLQDGVLQSIITQPEPLGSTQKAFIICGVIALVIIVLIVSVVMLRRSQLKRNATSPSRQTYTSVKTIIEQT